MKTSDKLASAKIINCARIRKFQWCIATQELFKRCDSWFEHSASLCLNHINLTENESKNY